MENKDLGFEKFLKMYYKISYEDYEKQPEDKRQILDKEYQKYIRYRSN